MIKGHWAAGDIRRAFVAGATWWEFTDKGATMWQSDRELTETKATEKYGEGKIVAFGKAYWTLAEAKAQIKKYPDKGWAVRKLTQKVHPRIKKRYHVGTLTDYLNYA